MTLMVAYAIVKCWSSSACKALQISHYFNISFLVTSCFTDQQQRMPQSSNLSQVTKTTKSLQNVQAQESWEARENSSHLTDLNAKFEIFITAQL